MFCANCGTKLEDGARFCPDCGASQQSQADVRKTEYPNSYGGGAGARTMGRVIRRFDFDKAGTAALVSGLINAVIYIVFSGVWFYQIDKMDNNLNWLQKAYYKSEYESAKGFFITMAVIFLMLAIFWTVTGIIKKKLYAERFLAVNENGISGIGPGTIDLKNVRFEFYYSDIVKVEKLWRGVRVYTNTGKFMIAASKKGENQQIIDIIRSHVGR